MVLKNFVPEILTRPVPFLFFQPKIYPDLDNTSGAYLKRTIARTMEGKGDKENRDPEVEEEPKNDDKARKFQLLFHIICHFFDRSRFYIRSQGFFPPIQRQNMLIREIVYFF